MMLLCFILLDEGDMLLLVLFQCHLDFHSESWTNTASWPGLVYGLRKDKGSPSHRIVYLALDCPSSLIFLSVLA